MAVAVEERVRTVKVATDELVFVVEGLHLVTLDGSRNRWRCASCPRQPCPHAALALSTIAPEQEEPCRYSASPVR